MAIIDELGLWRGKMGDSVYFVRNGKQYRRAAPGPRKGTPTKGMKRLGLFAIEFGLASSVAKFLRAGLAQELQQLGIPNLIQRFNAVALKVKNLDTAPVGSRTFRGGLETTEGKHYFKQFSFLEPPHQYAKVLSAVVRGTEIEVRTKPYRAQTVSLTILQINLENGDFHRSVHPLPIKSKGIPILIKQEFPSKEGYVEFVFIFSSTFLQGVVITREVV